MTSLDKLRPAAEEGNIGKLYEVIEEDPSIFVDKADSEQFLETPLHIAASKGHLPFAIEIMNLKPSYALKLNPQGWSPIHIAIANNEKRMVLCFVDMNKDLVRVKGREGWTPIHFASEIGELELLAEFLTACPDSINDVTVRGETALHIAVKNNKYEALHLLVSFLRKNTDRGARMLGNKILNQKDLKGNTILHISAENNLPKELRLLVKTNINLNAKNIENKTAFDMAIEIEIKSILSRAGAKSGSKVTDSQTVASKLKSMTTIMDGLLIYIFRFKSDISEEQRNALLIILTLIITATYQSVLSPPGGIYQPNDSGSNVNVDGFYQANASDNNVNITSSNSTIVSNSIGIAGTSVMSDQEFYMFSYFNMISFSISMITILILTPTGRVGFTMFMPPMISFAISYLHSMWIISPTHFTAIIVVAFFSRSVGSIVFVFIIFAVYSTVQKLCNAMKLNRS